LHRYLADAAVARKCLDLAPAFGHDRRVIVMSAMKVKLPPELAPLTARFTLDLPDADELKSVVKRVVAECARERPVSMGLSPADLDRLVDRLRGFTTFEAERAILLFGVQGPARRCSRAPSRASGNRGPRRPRRGGPSAGGFGGPCRGPPCSQFSLDSFCSAQWIRVRSAGPIAAHDTRQPSNRRSVRFSQVMRPRHDRSSWRR